MLAYFSGFASQKTGGERASCPYPKGTLKAVLWFYGFDDGSNRKLRTLSEVHRLEERLKDKIQ